MKKLILVLMFLVSSLTYCRIITVDNKYPSIGDFTTLRSALRSVYNSGDTIFLLPSPQDYQGDTVLRKTVILGVGWDKPALDSYLSSISGIMYFSPSSNGAFLEGLLLPCVININADNISIKRNKITTCCANIYLSHNNILIENNLIESYGSSVQNNNGLNHGLLDIADSNIVTIINNLFHNLNTGGAYAGDQTYNSSKVSILTVNGQNSSLLISNNIFILQVAMETNGWTGAQSVRNWDWSIITSNNSQQVRNNIFINGVMSCPSNSTSYNLGFNTTIPGGEANYNILLTDTTTLFIAGGYHLQANSPAKSKGRNGVDIGIYGGSTPFVDGGYPGIPSIIDLQSDHAATKQNGIQIKLKAKSNKD